MTRSALVIVALLGCASMALAAAQKKSVMATLTFENSAAACQRNAEIIRKNVAASVCKVAEVQAKIFGPVKTTRGRRLLRQGADDAPGSDDNRDRSTGPVVVSDDRRNRGSDDNKGRGRGSDDVYCQITVLCKGNLQAAYKNCEAFRIRNNDDRIKARTSPLLDYKTTRCTYSNLV